MKKKNLISLSAFLLLLVTAFGIFLYIQFFGAAVYPKGGRAVLLIPEGASIGQAMDSVSTHFEIRNKKILEWVSVKKGYPGHIRPGRYVIEKALSCNQLINILRGGRQTPVRVTFNNVRTLYDLAGKVGGQIEADSADIITFLGRS